MFFVTPSPVALFETKQSGTRFSAKFNKTWYGPLHNYLTPFWSSILHFYVDAYEHIEGLGVAHFQELLILIVQKTDSLWQITSLHLDEKCAQVSRLFGSESLLSNLVSSGLIFLLICTNFPSLMLSGCSTSGATSLLLPVSSTSHTTYRTTLLQLSSLI